MRALGVRFVGIKCQQGANQQTDNEGDRQRQRQRETDASNNNCLIITAITANSQLAVPRLRHRTLRIRHVAIGVGCDKYSAR